MSGALIPAAVFRRRSGWEATDMGILLWQNNWLPLLLFTGIPAGILTLLTDMLPAGSGITVATAAFWWIKPLLDRFCLQVVSVRFFEPSAAFRRLFSGLFKTLRRGLAADLLWRRFSPSRSARMPLVVLEQLKGKNYRRRKKLLARNGLGFGPALTVICMGMDIVLNAGVLIFVYGIFDLMQDGYAGTLIEFIAEEHIVVSFLFWINFMLIETLYVCMGFGLYINSRVETEGWDIELLFKNCVEKAGARSLVSTPSAPGTTPEAAPPEPEAAPAAPSLAVLAPLVMALLFLLCQAVPAQENPPVEQDPRLEQMLLRPAELSQHEQETLDNVFDSLDFGKEKATWKVQFKQSDTADSPIKFRDRFFPDLREILGIILRFTVGAVIAAAVLIGAVYAYRNRGRLFPALAGKSRAQRDPVSGEPWRLLKEAEENHRAGKIREAWALCFRAFAAFFAGHFPLPAEATEYEALALARKNGADTGGFALFVKRWVGFAYGGRKPGEGMFEEALASCRSLLASGGQP